MQKMESQEILKLLKHEAELFNATNGSPRYIGLTWFNLAFNAIHLIVCGRGNWPHPPGSKCNERRNPRTFDQIEWDQGSIADLALRLIDDKFLKEDQSSVILAASSDRHGANLAARHASQLLSRIQTKEREAGRITMRLVRIFDSRGQYFAGDETTKPYFSSDGHPASPEDPDPAELLEPVLSRLPVRPWKGGDHEEGSPYGVATLRVAATNILETVRAVGKWAIFDIFEKVLAHQQNVFLAIGRGVPQATGSAHGAGIDGNSVISMQLDGLSDELIEDARRFALEILGVLTDQERHTWSLHGESANTIEQMGLSRQTHSNRMQKLAKSIIEKADNRTQINTSDIDSSDVQEYCLVVFEELTSLLDSEKQSV